jgi:RNA polymerase sigma-70 factor (ECF subfamily)
MEKNPLADALDRVRLLATAGRFTDLSDGALLDRCVTERDEVAFSVLVDRHGAMVYGACYRILRPPHDTEDACQATFLVLAHKASGIRAAPSVASWLHGVARRVSLTLLLERAERQRRELSAPLPEPASAEPPT